MKHLFVAVALLGAIACSSQPKPEAAAGAPISGSPVPIGQLPSVDTKALLDHVKVLASDEYEGRAPGTQGETLSGNYIADAFKQVGPQPGNTEGTHLQNVQSAGTY